MRKHIIHINRQSTSFSEVIDSLMPAAIIIGLILLAWAMQILLGLAFPEIAVSFEIWVLSGLLVIALIVILLFWIFWKILERSIEILD